MHKCNQESVIKTIHEENEQQKNQINRLETAIFGDAFTKEKGMKDKVDDMHSLLVGTSVIKTFVVWVFSTTLAIGGAVLMWFEVTKSMKDK